MNQVIIVLRLLPNALNVLQDTNVLRKTLTLFPVRLEHTVTSLLQHVYLVMLGLPVGVAIPHHAHLKSDVLWDITVQMGRIKQPVLLVHMVILLVHLIRLVVVHHVLLDISVQVQQVDTLLRGNL